VRDSAGFLADARSGRFFMRFAEMVKVITPGRRDRLCRSGISASVALIIVAVCGLLAPGWTSAQQPAPTKTGAPAVEKKSTTAAGKAKATTKSEPAKDKTGDDDAAAKDEKKGDQPPAELPPDPSQGQKAIAVEVFQDPNAVEVMDLKKFNPIRNRKHERGDVEAVKSMAQDPNMPVDTTQIRRVVDSMIADLTDTRNIQALIDPPPDQKANAATVQAIENATTTLLEPLFTARANNSTRFLAEYNRILLASLPRLLKHHLVPRIQAMIILGQSGNPDALKTFTDAIKDPQQTVWVKLWALRGISNIKQYAGGRLSAQQEIDAAKVIADLLDKKKDLPWPVQLRALEALANLRHGFVPTSPKKADLAASAMRVLADPKARPDVRAEAARALGMMQITAAVPNFNFGLIAYAAAGLAAQLGDQIVANYSDKGAALNEPKAQHLTFLLLGPLYQAFDGQPGARDSGLLHVNPAARGEVQHVLNQIRPVAAASLDLVRAPAGQRKQRRQDLVTRVAALKDYLAKNAPANRHLVPDDEGYLEPEGAQAGAPEEPDAAKVAGARGGR
jgi:hypothetical protein